MLLTTRWPLVLIPLLLAAASAPAAPRTTTRPAASGPTANNLIDAERVTLTTEQGHSFNGLFVPPRSAGARQSPMILLIPDEKETMESFGRLLAELRDAGCTSLVVDMTASAANEEDGTNTSRSRSSARRRSLSGFDRLYRVTAGYLWLAERPGVDPARYLLIGSGSGGALALEVAAKDPSVDGVVWLSPEDGAKITSRLSRDYGDREALILVAGRDAQDGNRLARDLARGSCSHLIPLLNGDPGLRGTQMIGRMKGLEQHILNFIEKVAGTPSKSPVGVSINSDVYHAADSSWIGRIKPENLRWLSSEKEAESRGLRPARQRGRSR